MNAIAVNGDFNPTWCLLPVVRPHHTAGPWCGHHLQVIPEYVGNTCEVRYRCTQFCADDGLAGTLWHTGCI
jgi:hypothetical protein